MIYTCTYTKHIPIRRDRPLRQTIPTQLFVRYKCLQCSGLLKLAGQGDLIEGKHLGVVYHRCGRGREGGKGVVWRREVLRSGGL